MAQTTIASGNQVTKWDNDFLVEYVRDAIFADHMGTDENKIIRVKMHTGAMSGNVLSIPLVTRLVGSGVENDNTLSGNEEALGNFNCDVTIKQVRNATLVGRHTQKSTVIDIVKAAKTLLKMWIADDLRDEILTVLGSPNTDGVTAYASCTEAQKDTWVGDQNYTSPNHRVLFGATLSNYSADDHSTSLSTIDGTTDKHLFDQLQLAKRLAKKADPHIKPIRVKAGREFFVEYSESFAFRDLKIDTETIHQNAGARGKDNPLFQDPDLMLDGVIVREVPEISTYADVGDSGTVDVAPNYFCGAQAVSVVWGERTNFVVSKGAHQDYDNNIGVAVREMRGVKKSMYTSRNGDSTSVVQHGLVTVYSAGQPDS